MEEKRRSPGGGAVLKVVGVASGRQGGLGQGRLPGFIHLA